MKKIFVISPIGSEESETRKQADKVLKHIIKPVSEELGYEAIRSDEEVGSNLISKSVIRNIVEADIVIADLTEHNPNVFYELAVRHTIAKPVIQIIKDGEKIPFDISHQRTISYRLDLDGAEQAKESLKAFIKDISSGVKVENPVTEVLGLERISGVKSDDLEVNDALQELTNEIKRIPEYLKDMESRMAGRMSQVAETQPIGNNLMEGLSTEDKMGMVMIEKIMSNPNALPYLFEMMSQGSKK